MKATGHVHSTADGRRVVDLDMASRRLMVAGGLIGCGLLLSIVALTGLVSAPTGFAPMALLVLLAGVAVAAWPSSPVVIEEQAQRVRLPGGAGRVPFSRVRGVVLFTAVHEPANSGGGGGAGPACATAVRASRSVYLLTSEPPRKRSRLRREIARWGAHNPEAQRLAIEIEAEAASDRLADAGLLDELLTCRDRLVAHSLSCPSAWAVARHLATAIDVPLIHHAGHLAVLSPQELNRPLIERTAVLECEAAPPLAPSAVPAGLSLAVVGEQLQASWVEPRLAHPGTTAWWLIGGGLVAWFVLLVLGLGEEALAAWAYTAVALPLLLLLGLHVPPQGPVRASRLRTAWGLSVGGDTVSVWRGTPEREVARLRTDAVTDLFIVDRNGRGLAIATANDYAQLPMSRHHASILRQAIRAHFATLAANASSSAEQAPASDQPELLALTGQ